MEVKRFSCFSGSLEFWKIKNGIHTPTLDITFANKVIEWLMLHKIT
jgi:hypothetical protein